MLYQLKRNVISRRFLILFLFQAVLYYYMNRWNLIHLYPYQDFYASFIGALSIEVPLLTLICAALVGLHTHDELQRNYQPLLFSRTSIPGWIWRKFIANALTCGIFIMSAWVVILLICFFRCYPPRIDLLDYQQHVYISIVSSKTYMAIIQMILLDLVRAFLFGIMLGAIATLGAVAFKVRYLALAFPAVMYIIFSYYVPSPGLLWSFNFNIIVIANNFIEPWFSFPYFALSALFFFGLAYYFVLRRVRHE